MLTHSEKLSTIINAFMKYPKVKGIQNGILVKFCRSIFEKLTHKLSGEISKLPKFQKTLNSSKTLLI